MRIKRELFLALMLRLFGFSLILLSTRSFAQLPQCGWVYYLEDTGNAGHILYSYDPSQPISTANPSVNTIALPLNSKGLAVGDNINGSGPSPTFYTTFGGYYYYYDGVLWVNTGHLAGGPGSANANLGAGGGFIYNLYSDNGLVSRYDGSGNATDIIMPPIIGDKVGDIVADCQGNFYIISWAGNSCEKFSSSGIFITSWILSFPFPGAYAGGGGLAFIADTIFLPGNMAILNNSSSVLYFNAPLTIGLDIQPSDMASCPGGSFQGTIQANIDTSYYCGDSSGISLTAFGAGNPMAVNWSVLDGEASIIGHGFSINVASNGISNILLSSTCYNPDTVTIIGIDPVLNAGVNKLITGCHGYYEDTLRASISNTIPEVTYNYSWSPVSLISSGSNSLCPIISPISDTTYLFTVSTPANMGGCIWSDSVKVFTSDSTVIADFSYKFNYGCSGSDTVFIGNLSTGSYRYNWSFGNGSLSTLAEPTIIYPYGSYVVFLTSSNNICQDTISKRIIVPSHNEPFDLGSDISICHGDSILITFQAILSPGATITWSDGSSQPYLTVRDTGAYWVTVINSPCIVTDTVRINNELCDCSISIPSAFSPNNDGHNDLFRPIIEAGCQIKGFVLNIYNRWGQLVYSGFNINLGWDGTFYGEPADIGSYMYTIQLEAGTRFKKYQYSGDVTLIR